MLKRFFVELLHQHISLEKEVSGNPNHPRYGEFIHIVAPYFKEMYREMQEEGGYDALIEDEDSI